MVKRGWRKESYRHGLAAKGIRTGRAIPAQHMMSVDFTEDDKDQLLDAARFAGLQRELCTERAARYNKLVRWFEDIAEEPRASNRITLEFEFIDTETVMKEVDELDIPDNIKARLRYRESAKEQKVYLWLE